MRVLLLGAGGMLGHDIIAETPNATVTVARSRADVDITDALEVRAALREAKPDVIINCAAYTDVDEAETHRETAFAVNGDGPGIIGRAALNARTPLVVHFSTDYVFNGRADTPYLETDAPDPLATYGASKLAGERALAESGVCHLIVRTQWLFGLHGRSFPRTMWNRAMAQEATLVVSDQRGRPTYTVDLARAVWRLLDTWRGGVPPDGSEAAIVHVANTGAATWYDVAAHIFRHAGAPELVSACNSDAFPARAARPASSVLDTTRYERLAGSSMPSWRDAIDRFLVRMERAAQCK